jgi:hypothetical protein
LEGDRTSIGHHPLQLKDVNSIGTYIRLVFHRSAR